MSLIIAILFIIALILYERKHNRDELRRMDRECARDLARYRLQLDREWQELHEMCAGKSAKEKEQLYDEFRARRKKVVNRSLARLRELDRQEKAAGRTVEVSHGMSPGTKGALLLMAGAALGSMGKKNGSSNAYGHTDRSYGSGCSCEDYLDEQHEDCHDDSEL